MVVKLFEIYLLKYQCNNNARCWEMADKCSVSSYAAAQQTLPYFGPWRNVNTHLPPGHFPGNSVAT